MPQEKMKTQGAWEVYHLCIHNPKEDVHHNRCGDLSSLSIIIKKRCTATNVDKRGSSKGHFHSFSLQIKILRTFSMILYLWIKCTRSHRV